MIEKLISFLHVAPLAIILTIIIASKIYQKFTAKKIDFSPTILLLSSVGIASGFGMHHHSGEEVSNACYLCLGYALILAVVGLKLAKESKVAKQSI